MNRLELPFDNIVTLKMHLLAHECLRWVGVSERGGDNRGQIVEMFQRAVDGKAVGEPWCMGLPQYGVRQVDSLVDQLFLSSVPCRTVLYSSELCMEVFEKSPVVLEYPVVGSIAIWNRVGTRLGHAGVVVETLSGGKFITVEGNTSDSKGIEREGQVVAVKERSMAGMGVMQIKGFVQPWVAA